MFKFIQKFPITFKLFLINSFNFILYCEAKAQTPPAIIPAGVNQPLNIPHNIGSSNNDYLSNQLLPGIATTIIALTGGLSLVFVIISGIQYLTAYGDPAKAGTAKKTLIYALLGLVIGSLSYAIVAIIASIRPQ